MPFHILSILIFHTSLVSCANQRSDEFGEPETKLDWFPGASFVFLFVCILIGQVPKEYKLYTIKYFKRQFYILFVRFCDFRNPH